MISKYHDITRDIRQGIMTGKWKPRQQLPTREELITEYGTSRATMQKTINTLLREGFLYTNNKTGTFVADRPPNLYSVAIVFPVNESNVNFTDALWDGIIRQHNYLEEHLGYRLIFSRLYSYDIEHEDFQRIINDAEELRIAGIIFADKPPEAAIHALRKLQVPRVLLYGEEVSGLNNVNVDYYEFYRQAVQHLHSCNCKRVGLIVNTEMPPRYIAPARLLADDLGILMPRKWEISISFRHSPEYWVRNIVKLWFTSSSKTERPDGLIVGNENLLEYVVDALKYENIKPEQDVKLVSHANFPINRPKPCQLQRIGFDVRNIIENCLLVLKESGYDNLPLPVKMVPPVIEQDSPFA
ncbi:MAG: GntR family transcriptional regulator [Victivallales bacterium]|nr:GntR family transcriptional regulator [Victivallales bacterium]